jgi:DNA-binding GntR family transcriptional regulator
LAVEPLSHLDRSTLRERTLHALRAAITQGQYRPGDRLGETELATHLGVSRGTVRQALRDLQHEGLVTSGHRSVLRVRSLSSEEVRQLFRVRAALEGLGATQVISSADRQAAADSLREALAHLVDPHTDFIARVDAELAFHLLLCRLSDNGVLVETWRHLEGRLRLVIVAAGPVEAEFAMSREPHEAIIDTIERGSPAAAVEVIDRHMTLAADQLVAPPRFP